MLTKKELKKKILNYAYEQCCAKREDKPDIGQFSIETLGKSLAPAGGVAKHRFYEALHELFLQNIIMKDPYHGALPYSFTLTTKGKEIAEKQLDINEYSLRLENFIVNEDLLGKCQELFNSGEYETAIFSAYRLLEVKVRGKAYLTANDIGQKLMSKAFKVSEGKLRISTCETPSEELGIQNLFVGAIATFKNPTSHRLVDYKDPRVALQILVFSELLLNLVEMAEPREPLGSK